MTSGSNYKRTITRNGNRYNITVNKWPFHLKLTPPSFRIFDVLSTSITKSVRFECKLIVLPHYTRESRPFVDDRHLAVAYRYLRKHHLRQPSKTSHVVAWENEYGTGGNQPKVAVPVVAISPLMRRTRSEIFCDAP